MNKKFTMLCTAVMLLSPCLAQAVQIKGIELAPQVTQPASEQKLVLNGAGIRSKFIFDIYVGALYLIKPSKDAKQILNNTGSKRISMHFLYKKIEKEKMVNGWLSGFKDNLNDEQFKALKPSIDQFNQAFDETSEGDVIIIDFVANLETLVTINNQKKARIPGAEFQKALLSIWLGDKPVDDDLKNAMLEGYEAEVLDM